MGQGDILKLLKKKKKPMTTKEISKELGISNGAVSRSLKSLSYYGEVSWSQDDWGKVHYKHKEGLFGYDV